MHVKLHHPMNLFELYIPVKEQLQLLYYKNMIILIENPLRLPGTYVCEIIKKMMIFRFLHGHTQGRMLSSILKDMNPPFHVCTTVLANFKGNTLIFNLNYIMSGIQA